MIIEGEQLFMYLLATCSAILRKMFIQICCSVLLQLFIIVLLSGKHSLCILGIDSSSDS